jgi:hypothetical protein
MSQPLRSTRIPPWQHILISVVVVAGIQALNQSQVWFCNTLNPSESVREPRQAIRTSHVSNLTLLPGELPGYTGWGRPATTLANQFAIKQVSGPPVTGNNFTVSLVCWHPTCRSGGALFYVRAYGRSILPGIVIDHLDGTYDITLLPFDAGIYQLEVVIVFSNPPPMSRLPVPNQSAYEGYLLPGFPMELNVAQDDDRVVSQSPSRLCTMSEMLETSTTSAIATGRWLVTEKMTERAHASDDVSVDRRGYISGVNSLGIRMDYVPTLDCRLLSEAELLNRSTILAAVRGTKLEPKPIRIVFLGDSNIRLQAQLFNKSFGNILSTHIETNGGIVRKLETIKAELKELAQRDEHFFVIFNTGLHSLFELCDSGRSRDREKYINISDSEFSCVEQYKRSLQELVNAVQDFPALVRIWQTSMSAWPKWGVFSVAWPSVAQTYPLAPNGCEHFNEIAWDIMTRANISVMDSYWLTLSRPDHRQVDEKNSLVGHLMHAGPEVYSVLTRKWAMIILEVIRSSPRSK